MVTSLEKNKNENNPHLHILCLERYGHLYMSQPVIQAKCHRGTEEGEPAGIYERVLEKIIKADLEIFQQM